MLANGPDIRLFANGATFCHLVSSWLHRILVRKKCDMANGVYLLLGVVILLLFVFLKL